MRNFKKIGAIFFVFCLMLSLTSPALMINVKAFNKKISMGDRVYLDRVSGFPDYFFVDTSPYTLVEGDFVLCFENEQDYFRYKNKCGNRDAAVIPFYGEGVVVEVEEREVKNQLWIGYHSLTPSWSKSSSYSCSAGHHYSAAGEYKWKDFTFQLGISYTAGMTITYPADSERWSKLGTWGDFIFERRKVTELKYGQPTGYVYHVWAKKMTEHYIGVVYK